MVEREWDMYLARQGVGLNSNNPGRLMQGCYVDVFGGGKCQSCKGNWTLGRSPLGGVCGV